MVEGNSCNVPKVSAKHSFAYLFQDLYAQGRSNAGVLFASIPNFADFYSEDVNEGMECIRLLNEIIGKGLKYKWFLNVLGTHFHDQY